MDKDELHIRLVSLFGPVKTDAKAAAALRVDRSTVQRWLGGKRRIPGPVIAWLEKADEAKEWKSLFLDAAHAIEAD